jgi:uncharacterized protein (DUF1015 family)
LADVKPFVCCRPLAELASEVAALPYDVFSRHEAAVEIDAHPRSFLRIDKTAALFADEVDEYDDRVYARAAELFAADRQAGVYLCEDEPHYFLYRLVKEGHAQTGVVACVAVDDYERGVLRRHENTRAFKLDDRVRHIRALGAQTGPVFVTYRAQAVIDEATRAATAADPLYDFVAPDGVRHTVWRVDDPQTERAIQSGFAALDALYIADGHHRAAAAARIAAHRCAEWEQADECSAGSASAAGETRDASSHFLIVAFPSNQLEILDYNRVVSDTNGLSRDELLARVAERFDVEQVGEEPCRPRAKGEFAMYLDTQWYRLTIHDEWRSGDPVGSLDASLLQDNLLAPILGIDDPRTSKRIAYVGGVRGLEELQRRADGSGESAHGGARPAFRADEDVSLVAHGQTARDGGSSQPARDDRAQPARGGGVAFALFPCSLDELFEVADAGCLMPPKSTWFEPKPRSGLFIHQIGGAPAPHRVSRPAGALDGVEC